MNATVLSSVYSHQAHCKECNWWSKLHHTAGQAHDAADAHNGAWHTTLPAGIISLTHIPYGERRWNGAVWPAIQVDRYNAELDRIASRHQAGMDVQHLVDGLYNLAAGFDQAGKP